MPPTPLELKPAPTAMAGARAVLVAVQLPGVSEAEIGSSLDELARLTRTLGSTRSRA